MASENNTRLPDNLKEYNIKGLSQDFIKLNDGKNPFDNPLLPIVSDETIIADIITNSVKEVIEILENRLNINDQSTQEKVVKQLVKQAISQKPAKALQDSLSETDLGDKNKKKYFKKDRDMVATAIRRGRELVSTIYKVVEEYFHPDILENPTMAVEDLTKAENSQEKTEKKDPNELLAGISEEIDSYDLNNLKITTSDGREFSVNVSQEREVQYWFDAIPSELVEKVTNAILSIEVQERDVEIDDQKITIKLADNFELKSELDGWGQFISIDFIRKEKNSTTGEDIFPLIGFRYNSRKYDNELKKTEIDIANFVSKVPKIKALQEVLYNNSMQKDVEYTKQREEQKINAKNQITQILGSSSPLDELKKLTREELQKLMIKNGVYAHEYAQQVFGCSDQDLSDNLDITVLSEPTKKYVASVGTYDNNPAILHVFNRETNKHFLAEVLFKENGHVIKNIDVFNLSDKSEYNINSAVVSYYEDMGMKELFKLLMDFPEIHNYYHSNSNS